MSTKECRQETSRTSSLYNIKRTNDSIIEITSNFDEKSPKNKSSAVLIINFIPRIISLFGFAFVLLYVIILLVRSIPNLSLPTSVEAVKYQAVILENYSNETWQGYLHIIVVL